jgi:hypothetical protein
MRKRVFIATLAAAALLVAPVAGTDAKPDGVGGGKPEGVGGGKPEGVGGGKPEGVGGGKPEGGGNAKKCEKPRLVGFKVNGTFMTFIADDTEVIGDLTVNVIRANRHARDWLGGETSATFVIPSSAKIKFIGVTDIPGVTGTGTIGFEDALNTPPPDRVKLKGKLELLKHGCPVEDAVPVEDTVPEVGAEDTQLETSTDLEVTKVKVKRPNENQPD